ncbi:hypothetical protein [Actinoplanes sp. CA-252034]|uniref:hypothetical protein n=1 Tax=Actinoplanes sp. CA-252034 TaxID=3239906 RepID=UPI003D990495
MMLVAAAPAAATTARPASPVGVSAGDGSVNWAWTSYKSSDSASQCNNDKAGIVINYSGDYKVIVRMNNSTYTSYSVYDDLKSVTDGFNSGYLSASRTYASGTFDASGSTAYGVASYDSGSNERLTSSVNEWSFSCGYTYEMNITDSD